MNRERAKDNLYSCGRLNNYQKSTIINLPKNEWWLSAPERDLGVVRESLRVRLVILRIRPIPEKVFKFV